MRGDVLLTCLAVVLANGGCKVFDESLLTEPVAGAPVDRCDSTVPIVGSSAAAFFVDTSVLTSNYRAFAGCVGHELPGNDGFFSIVMKRDERWHVHVTAEEMSLDPAVYILPACDERSCEPGHGLDVCGAGGAEHLSFVAPNDGTFLVGLDSRTPGGGRFSVTVVKPTCGNGTREHSETCEDGNTEGGDGCDKSCRKELTATAVEAEPNDDPPGPNILLMPDASPAVTVSAKFATGSCDVDVYAVPVPANGGLRTRVMSATNARGCAAVEMTLVSPNGKTVLRSGTTGADGCQSIDFPPEAGRAAAEYFVRVTTKETASFDYILRVER
jgi:cysteine-rich repeat protein